MKGSRLKTHTTEVSISADILMTDTEINIHTPTLPSNKKPRKSTERKCKSYKGKLLTGDARVGQGKIADAIAD